MLVPTTQSLMEYRNIYTLGLGLSLSYMHHILHHVEYTQWMQYEVVSKEVRGTFGLWALKYSSSGPGLHLLLSLISDRNYLGSVTDVMHLSILHFFATEDGIARK